MYRPNNFATVSPYFMVENAPGFIRFLQQAFGGQEIGRTEDGGRIRNAQINISDCAIMVAEAAPDFAPMSAAYYLYVEDVDQTMTSAIAAGAELIFAAEDMPYGDRQGGIKDPFGNYWWISKRLNENNYYD